MTYPKPWKYPVVAAQKVIGRLRRALTKIPAGPMIATINGKIQFEHAPLPFLDMGDLKAMLTGSYDIILCDYLKRHLAPGDTMLDVGANVGYISAIAASCVGENGQVHGFEPLPICFARLERLKALNPRIKFKFNNVALAEEDGFLPIAYNPQGDSRNATLVPGKNYAETIQVPVMRLDQYIGANIPKPEKITLIKIDVEGYEFPVLKGLSKFFETSKHRPLIVCEIKPWELKKLGASLSEFDSFMRRYGYRAHVIPDDHAPINMTSLTDMEVLVFRP